MHKNFRIAALSANLTLSLLYTLLILGSSAPYALAAGNASPINLYFHNDTSNPSVGGALTRSVSTLNTTQLWRAHAQGYLNFTSRALLDFYLHPDLAGSFTIDGTVFLHPWVAGFGTGGSPTKAGFTVALYDVSSSGQVLVATSASSGSETLPFGSTSSQSRDVNSVAGNLPLTFSTAAYTFLPRHSILVHVEILPQGSGSTISFYFDNAVTPSYVTLYSQNIVSVTKTWTTNSMGSPTAQFNSTGANLQVDILANVTDPLGGYDINASTAGATYARVNLNLTSPTGIQLLVRQAMNLLSGGQLSFVNLFRLNYTLTAFSPGQYNFTAIAIDNSGNTAIGSGFFRVSQAQGSPPPFTSTTAFQLGSLLLLFLVVAAIFIYAVSRRRKSQPTSPKAPSSMLHPTSDLHETAGSTDSLLSP